MPMNRSLCYSLSSLKHYCSSSENILKPGDVMRQTRIFSTQDIEDYSKLTRDFNPLHFDLGLAKNAGFEDIPVPGILVASLFPRIIASHFPGAVYVKQTLDFRSPVLVGDDITGQVEALSVRKMKEKYMYTVKFVTTCLKGAETVVIGGEAMAILPSLNLKAS